MNASKKILLIDNTAHHLYTQMHVFKSFKNAGYNIILVCPNDEDYFTKLQQLGYNIVAIHIDGKSKNIFKDLGLIYSLYALFKQLKPDLILSFTIKPNLYCGLVTKFTRIPQIPNITGLGDVFSKENILTKFILAVYKFAFSHLKYIFVQNNDDLQLLTKRKVFSPLTNAVRLPGSGVDTDRFAPLNLKSDVDRNKGKIIFLYSGRLLWSKGIGELVEAFRDVKNKYPNTTLQIAGNYFFANSAAILPEQIKRWEEEIGLEYLGMLDNINVAIARADCIVLPSYYREGVPRAIMEASSMGKPIITTDSIGCRDVVEDGITGFLCKVKNANDLASKMLNIVEMSYSSRHEMGMLGREKMLCEFNQKNVISSYVKHVEKLLK